MCRARTLQRIVVLATGGGLVGGPAPGRRGAQTVPAPRPGVVDTVKGEGLIPSANPAVRAFGSVRFAVERRRWPVPSTWEAMLPAFYSGKVGIDDPGMSLNIETVPGFPMFVRPWGRNGAAGWSLAQVNGPWMSPLPAPVCALEWWVDDLAPPGSDSILADKVAVRVSGFDRRCAYKHDTSLASGDIVVTYVGRPVLVGALALDRDEYFSQPNTIVCVTWPCPGNEVTAVAKYEFTVTNVSRYRSVSRFTSTCQHDVEVVDADGNVVLADSDGRPCGDALTTLELGPGESRTYTGEFELKDRDGSQLYGEFGARGFLIPDEGPGTGKGKIDSFVIKQGTGSGG